MNTTDEVIVDLSTEGGETNTFLSEFKAHYEGVRLGRFRLGGVDNGILYYLLTYNDVYRMSSKKSVHIEDDVLIEKEFGVYERVPVSLRKSLLEKVRCIIKIKSKAVDAATLYNDKDALGFEWYLDLIK